MASTMTFLASPLRRFDFVVTEMTPLGTVGPKAAILAYNAGLVTPLEISI